MVKKVKTEDHLVVITDIEKVRAADPRLSPLAKSGCLYCKNCGQHYNMGTVGFNLAMSIYEGFKLDHIDCELKDGMD